jgi:hypothetical protein
MDPPEMERDEHTLSKRNTEAFILTYSEWMAEN